MGLTASYSQTGKTIIIDGDTCKCYTKPVLERITTRVVRAKECDTLLSVCEQQLIYKENALVSKDSALFAKDSVIISKNIQIDLKEDIITGKDGEISDLRNELNKTVNRSRWLKIGWATTSVGLSGIIIALLLKG